MAWGPRIDLRRRRFERLTVLQYVGAGRWQVRCSCGVSKVVRGARLLDGGTRSCGCLRSELLAEQQRVRMTTHGRARTKEYRAWQQMHQRCTNKKKRGYSLYGGRGIKVCQRWRLFKNFLADMGPKPTPKHSLERKNNNRGYAPKNCKWATAKEQQRNRRVNRLIRFKGKTQPLRAWAELLGLHPNTVDWRLGHGWTVRDALSTQVRA